MTQPLLEPPSALPTPARLGEVLGGKYRLDRILAVGGMGVVVAATHLRLNQRIAIKFMSVLLGGRGGRDTEVWRFLLEARSAARIQSEHVVRVLDVETLPSGAPFIVMEYLEGEDLSRLMGRRGRLGVPEAIDYVLQACEAIAEAHIAGIVHRDLKPANLFCCRRPDGAALIKVLDFGVSKLLPEAGGTLPASAITGPHAIIGTPQYASPEQLRSVPRIDVRADIWALGVILYELVAGKPPFHADTFLALCAQITSDPCPSLHTQRSEVPLGLSDVVEKCLAKDPGDRFRTVAHLAAALAPFALQRSLLSVERIENILGEGTRIPVFDKTLLSAPDEAQPVLLQACTGARRKPRRRSAALPFVWWSVAAAAVAGAALGVAWDVVTRPRAASLVALTASAPSQVPSVAAETEPAASVSSAAPPLEAPPARLPAPERASPGAVHPRPARLPTAHPAPDTSGFGGLL